MNINLATIDFCPSQGGGGEAVIRSLDVTENGTYRAPSGVDGYNPVSVNVSGGGSITPEEQAALDTLVDSSKGILYTETYEKYNLLNIIWSDSIYANAARLVFWDDLYVIQGEDLYKLNRKSYQFDMIKYISGIWAGPSFFGDKSGRFYWDGYELDLENGIIGPVQISLPGIYIEGSLQNIFYGEYGVWILSNNAYKFNESTQEFEQMTLNSTFTYGGSTVYLNMFKYDGHILGVYNNLTFELTEYEDHIDVADVTNVYFNMPTFGADGFKYKSTKDGDLYIFNSYNVYIYDKSSGVWENVKYLPYPISGDASLVSDNIVFSFYNGRMYYMNLGQDFNKTFWTKTSNVAVDLSSNQNISGNKTFNGIVNVGNNLYVNRIYSLGNDIEIAAGNNNIKNFGTKIVFANNSNKETIIKNGSKQIATVDLTIINSTFIPYGMDGDDIGYVSGSSGEYYNFNTYTNRMFKRRGNDWYEFDGTNTLIPVSFGFDFSGDLVYNSPTMTITIAYDNVSGTYNTYMWNDANTRWDLICSSNDVYGSVWFDGDNFRSNNDYKLEETGGVWSWVSDPLVNNIYEYYYRFGYKNGEVYAYNDNDWHLYKYDKLNCTMDKIGFVNAGSRLYSYFNEMFFIMSGGEVHIVDLSKVDPQDPDAMILGDTLFIGDYIGARDRLWYYKDSKMCSSYQYIYEVPEVPASNGTYTLQATRVGDQITYEWVSNVI